MKGEGKGPLYVYVEILFESGFDKCDGHYWTGRQADRQTGKPFKLLL